MIEQTKSGSAAQGVTVTNEYIVGLVQGITYLHDEVYGYVTILAKDRNNPLENKKYEVPVKQEFVPHEEEIFPEEPEIKAKSSTGKDIKLEEAVQVKGNVLEDGITFEKSAVITHYPHDPS
jgi:hypothetical protein